MGWVQIATDADARRVRASVDIAPMHGQADTPFTEARVLGRRVP